MSAPAYAAATDVQRYIDLRTLILLTDDAGSGQFDTAAQAVVSAIIVDTQARIDSAMKAAGYVTPTAAPGDMLRSLTCRLCVGPLYARRPMVQAPEALDRVAKAAEDELKLLAADKTFVPEGVRAQFLGAVKTPISISSDQDRGWSGSDLF